MSLGMHSQHIPPPGAGGIFRSFLIDRPGKIIFLGNFLSRRESVRCLVRYISRDGADLEVSPFLDVSDHFFLTIQGSEDEIGCSLVRRDEERVRINFNAPIHITFINFLRRQSES